MATPAGRRPPANSPTRRAHRPSRVSRRHAFPIVPARLAACSMGGDGMASQGSAHFASFGLNQAALSSCRTIAPRSRSASALSKHRPQPSTPLSEVSVPISTYANPRKCGFEPANLRDFMRALYPRDTAKLVAGDLKVPPRTVENWLEMKATPNAVRLFQMIALWGAGFHRRLHGQRARMARANRPRRPPQAPRRQDRRAQAPTFPTRSLILRLVLLESPFAGKTDAETAANVDYAAACMRDCLTRGEAPFASHLLYTRPGVLDDKIPAERARGIEAGLLWGARAAASVVYTDLGISDGMRQGICRALVDLRPIEYRSLQAGAPAIAAPFDPRNPRPSIAAAEPATLQLDARTPRGTPVYYRGPRTRVAVERVLAVGASYHVLDMLPPRRLAGGLLRGLMLRLAEHPNYAFFADRFGVPTRGDGDGRPAAPVPVRGLGMLEAVA
jgi:hypothetical protein